MVFVDVAIGRTAVKARSFGNTDLALANPATTPARRLRGGLCLSSRSVSS
jgi:hypothetical protein